MGLKENGLNTSENLEAFDNDKNPELLVSTINETPILNQLAFNYLKDICDKPSNSDEIER